MICNDGRQVVGMSFAVEASITYSSLTLFNYLMD
jgi:hypothetical protein